MAKKYSYDCWLLLWAQNVNVAWRYAWHINLQLFTKTFRKFPLQFVKFQQAGGRPSLLKSPAPGCHTYFILSLKASEGIFCSTREVIRITSSSSRMSITTPAPAPAPSCRVVSSPFQNSSKVNFLPWKTQSDSLIVWQSDSLTVWDSDSLAVWQSAILTFGQVDKLTVWYYDNRPI